MVSSKLEKEGVVGAFCRTYSIEEAVEVFLADVYRPSVMQGRYDYVPADSQRIASTRLSSVSFTFPCRSSGADS